MHLTVQSNLGFKISVIKNKNKCHMGVLSEKRQKSVTHYWNGPLTRFWRLSIKCIEVCNETTSIFCHMEWKWANRNDWPDLKQLESVTNEVIIDTSSIFECAHIWRKRQISSKFSWIIVDYINSFNVDDDFWVVNNDSVSSWIKNECSQRYNIEELKP
jgi:hypothetical protein